VVYKTAKGMRVSIMRWLFTKR